ncbi:VanW family protein [Virgibacillus salarius]|nr:VanW family protein [Virgibacillus salarius]WBX82309.1 VanW family protein [Virgibacillus salarius]
MCTQSKRSLCSPGRDATVSWWGPDFSFKNMYNEPVLIRAHASNGKMLVRITSSDTVENFTGS